MNCQEMEPYLTAPPETWSDEAETHLAGCASCLGKVGGDWGTSRDAAADRLTVGDPPVGFGALSELLGAEAGTLGSIRAWSTGTRLLTAGAAALTVAVVAGVSSLRNDFGTYPRGALLLSAAGLVTLGAAGLWLRLWPIHRPRVRPETVTALLVAAGALLVAGALWKGYSIAGGSGLDAPLREHFAAGVAKCLMFGSVVAVLPLATFVFLDRAAPTLGMRLGGAVFAAAAGNLALELHCPDASALHLLLGHVALLPIVAFVSLRSAHQPKGR